MLLPGSRPIMMVRVGTAPDPLVWGSGEPGLRFVSLQFGLMLILLLFLDLLAF